MLDDATVVHVISCLCERRNTLQLIRIDDEVDFLDAFIGKRERQNGIWGPIEVTDDAKLTIDEREL